jgi:hypothetical protein
MREMRCSNSNDGIGIRACCCWLQASILLV